VSCLTWVTRTASPPSRVHTRNPFHRSADFEALAASFNHAWIKASAHPRMSGTMFEEPDEDDMAAKDIDGHTPEHHPAGVLAESA
jgi:hypothetical protein